MPPGAVAVVMTSAGAAMITVKLARAVARLASVTVAEMVTVPAVSGVPLSTPSGVAVTPDGSPVTVQV